MLGKLFHIVRSHPTRKFTFLWTSVFHLQLDDPELTSSAAEGSSLPHSVTTFRVTKWISDLLCPPVFLQQDVLQNLLNSALPSQDDATVRLDTASGLALTLCVEHGEERAAQLHRGSLVALAAKQVLCVKGVSLSHLREDSNQCCKPSTQILFRLRSMLGWSSDSLLKASCSLFIFRSTKGALLTSFLPSFNLIKCTMICLLSIAKDRKMIETEIPSNSLSPFQRTEISYIPCDGKASEFKLPLNA